MRGRHFHLPPIAVFALLAAAGIATFLALQGPKRQPPQQSAPGKPRIAATIFPLYDIARNIAGEDAEVVLVVPAGASPHTFEPLPSNIRELRGALAIYAIGHGLDDWTDRLTAATGVDKVVVDGGVALNEMRAEETAHEYGSASGSDEEHGHEQEGLDPHYWLTMANGAKIAQTIAEDLKQRLPGSAPAIGRRAERYFAALADADREMRRLLAAVDNRDIVTMHDAWYYFARAYDLRIAGTFEPTAGREPSPQYLTGLVSGIKASKARTLYSEPQLAPQSVASFLADNGLGLAILDPIGGVPGRENFIDLMLYNARTISENQ